MRRELVVPSPVPREERSGCSQSVRPNPPHRTGPARPGPAMRLAAGRPATLLLVLVVVAQAASSPSPNPRRQEEPLRLTPLLEAGNASAARALAQVPAMLDNCCSGYSGFFTVNKQFDSNLFFWFFRSETRRRTAPLVVWLQGGPGTSMMRPVFLENGPYRIDYKTRQLRRRRGAWTRSHNMLYFDSPVGTGYSFTRDPAGMATSFEQVSEALYEALRQFSIMFPGQAGRDLYIAGESYGGKMATGLAHLIHKRRGAGLSFKLKGLVVVNGLVDLETQLDKSELVYQLGMVDEAGRDEMKALADEQIRLVRAGAWQEAMKLSLDECGSVISPEDTGMVSLTNFLLWNGTQDDGFGDLAQHAHIRRALHVGNLTFRGRAPAVGRALRPDMVRSVLPLLAELTDNIRVLVVSGQLDLCIPYRLTSNYLRKMQWSGAAELDAARRVTWCVRGQLAGYARTVRNLSQVLVRNAGHYLGQDQPRWSADMMERFTACQSFSTCEDCYKP